MQGRASGPQREEGGNQDETQADKRTHPELAVNVRTCPEVIGIPSNGQRTRGLRFGVYPQQKHVAGQILRHDRDGERARESLEDGYDPCPLKGWFSGWRPGRSVCARVQTRSL